MIAVAHVADFAGLDTFDARTHITPDTRLRFTVYYPVGPAQLLRSSTLLQLDTHVRRFTRTHTRTRFPDLLHTRYARGYGCHGLRCLRGYYTVRLQVTARFNVTHATPVEFHYVPGLRLRTVTDTGLVGWFSVTLRFYVHGCWVGVPGRFGCPLRSYAHLWL